MTAKQFDDLARHCVRTPMRGDRLDHLFFAKTQGMTYRRPFRHAKEFRSVVVRPSGRSPTLFRFFCRITRRLQEFLSHVADFCDRNSCQLDDPLALTFEEFVSRDT